MVPEFDQAQSGRAQLLCEPVSLPLSEKGIVFDRRVHDAFHAQNHEAMAVNLATAQSQAYIGAAHVSADINRGLACQSVNHGMQVRRVSTETTSLDLIAIRNARLVQSAADVL